MIPNVAALEDIIKDLSREDAGIIVEGKRDVSALTGLGVSKKMILEAAQVTYSTLESRIRDKGYHKLVPLFDNDRTGEKRLAGFMSYFSGGSITIDGSYSRRTKRAGLACIEEIDDILERHRD